MKSLIALFLVFGATSVFACRPNIYKIRHDHAMQALTELNVKKSKSVLDLTSIKMTSRLRKSNFYRTKI